MTTESPATPDARDTGWIEARPPRAREVLLAAVSLPSLAWRNRDLIATGVRRDLAARLSGTLLGRAWPLLHPLLLFGIYYFVFTRLYGFRMPDLPPEQTAAMGVYMFVGVLVWSAFAESISRAVHAIVDQGNLIKKVAFPAEVLPLQGVLTHAVLMLAGILAFVLACLLTPIWPAPGAALLWIPAILVLQLAFTAGLTLLVSALQVVLRDTQHVVAAGMTIWMFVTPIFWVPSVEVLPGIAEWLPWIERNPTYDLVYAWRLALMSGEPAFVFAEPMGAALGRFALWSLASLMLGAGFFAALRRRLVDEV